MTRNSECENIFLWYVWRRNIFDSSVGQMEPITVLSFQIFLCFKDAAPSAPWEQIWHVSDHWSLKFSYIFQGQCISQSKKNKNKPKKNKQSYCAAMKPTSVPHIDKRGELRSDRDIMCWNIISPAVFSLPCKTPQKYIPTVSISAGCRYHTRHKLV